MTSSKGINKKIWFAIIMFGLFGQFAWVIENMYFNLFVYHTISTDPNIIANMVFASAVTATLTTLLIGALSDKIGKRKLFIVGGYILWGLSTMSFALIKVDIIKDLVGPALAVQATALVVVIMDCVMTFFGSSANDAAFNAWINDVVSTDKRGQVEGILAIFPLIAMLIIFGGFDGLTQNGQWSTFFIILGAIVLVGGIVGFFIIDDEKDLEPSDEHYIANMTYGFKRQTLNENKTLYITLIALAILGISTQIFMPFLIIYIQEYLKISNYAVVLGVVLIASSILSVVCGKWIDKVGQIKFMVPSLFVEVVGLVMMYFVRGMVPVIIAGTMMIGANMVVTACINSLVRNYTPKDKSGHFQGIRMLFNVLIPMAIGPYIGALIIKNSGQTYQELGTVSNVPTPMIFIAAAVVLLGVLIPAYFTQKHERMAKKAVL